MHSFSRFMSGSNEGWGVFTNTVAVAVLIFDQAPWRQCSGGAMNSGPTGLSMVSILSSSFPGWTLTDII